MTRTGLGRRALLALVATALAAPWSILGGAHQVAAAVPVESSDAPRIDIVSQSPWVEDDGTFILTVDLEHAPASGDLQIFLHREPLADRASFSRSLFGVGLGSSVVQVTSIPAASVKPDAEGHHRTNVVIALKRTLPGPPVPGQAGLSRGLRAAGVYPLELSLTDGEGVTKARVITYLVRLPERGAPRQPLRAALLLGLHAPPTVAPDGTDTAGPAEFTSIDATSQAVAAQPGVPLTIAPTPETVEAMARSSAATRGSLSDLAASLTDREVLDSPYVEVPITSWFNAGMDAQLVEQRARGSAILSQLLRTSPDSSTWVAGSDLTTEAASKLWQLGVRHLVVRPGAFAPIGGPRPEATLARPFIVDAGDTPLTAVAVDTTLQAAFNREADPELSAFQLLAELSLIEGEAPDATRGVVLAAPTGWNTSVPFLTTLLTGLQRHPLVKPVTLDALFREVQPLRAGADGTGAPVRRQLTPLPPPDLGSYPTDLAALRVKVDSFSGMVGIGDPAVGQWNQRMLLSGASSLSPQQRDAYLSTIDHSIDRQIAGIEASPQQTVTLTSRTGRIPLTLHSALKRSVHVVVALDASSRLQFPRDHIEYLLRPGTQQVQIPITARSPGDTPLTIRVTSPDAGLALADTRFTVRSTAVSGIGYVLSGGAALFLVVWWIRSWRRSRRDRHPGPQPPPTDHPDALPAAAQT